MALNEYIKLFKIMADKPFNLCFLSVLMSYSQAILFLQKGQWKHFQFQQTKSELVETNKYSQDFAEK